MNQKLQFHIVAAGVMAICLVAATAAADTYTLGPTEDVCVRDDYPNTAGNPTGSLLYVGGPIVSTNDYWTTFIKFDLSSYGAGTINSATLKLTCQSHSGSSVSVSTYEVTADPYDWDEDYMSQQTAEANLTVSTSPTANVTVNAANTAFSFDVTGAARNHKGGDFTICVKQSNQPSSGNWAMFYSKDYSTTPSYQPDLVLNYTPPSQDNGRIYIDFDPSFSIENIAYPDIYTGFDAYVVLDRMSQGFAGICFALSVTPGTSSPPAFENLLPGDLAIGDWETGITMASTDCVGMGGEPVNMAVLHLYYLGEPGDILILDHPEWPRWIVDCTQPYGLVTYYCVLSHGGVGKDAPPGDCGATPVQARSWTGIKSLYR